VATASDAFAEDSAAINQDATSAVMVSVSVSVEPLPDDVRHRLFADVRRPEITPRQAAEVVHLLDDHWAVEAVLCIDGRHLLR
jgi:hypothetical protein